MGRIDKALKELSEELEASGLPPNPASIVGRSYVLVMLDPDNSEVYLTSVGTVLGVAEAGSGDMQTLHLSVTEVEWGVITAVYLTRTPEEVSVHYRTRESPDEMIVGLFRLL